MFSYDQVMAAVAEAVEPLDGGQSQDYAALNILERIRGTPHPSIADKTARIMQFPRLKAVLLWLRIRRVWVRLRSIYFSRRNLNR